MEKKMKTGRWLLFWVCSGAAFWGLLAYVVIGLSGCMYVSGTAGEEASAKVTFLDVGQGLAVLLEYEGSYALYDAGPDSVGVMDSLRHRGVDTLQWVVASHYHRDHVGGLFELEAAGKSQGGTARPVVKRLYVGLDTTGGFIRDSLMRVAKRFAIPVDTIFRGHEIQLQGRGASLSANSSAEGLRLKALWPPEYLPLGDNESSVVLDGGSFLLTGDLDSAAERRLLELSPSLQADLLQVPHHGSAGSNSLNFLAKTSPKYAAISVGKNNGYGHPAPSVLRKLGVVMGDTTTIYRTDLDGAITFQIIPGVGVVR